MTHTRKSRSAFDGYNRGLHWERTCTELAKLRITRGPRGSAAEQPIAASGDRVDPWLVTLLVTVPLTSTSDNEKSWRRRESKAAPLARHDARCWSFPGSAWPMVHRGRQRRTVTLTVVDAANGCAPIAGAHVEIWHCDADGVYSEYANGMNPGSTSSTYLRGVQTTDASGKVTFTTIYPATRPCYRSA